MFNIKPTSKNQKVFPTIFDLILYTLLFIVSSLIALFVSDKTANLLEGIVDNILGFKLFLTYVLSFSLTAAAMQAYRSYRTCNNVVKTPLSATINFKPFSSLTLLWGIILMFASSIVVDPLVVYFPDSSDEITQVIMSMGSYATWCTVFAAPLLEEIIFRGILLNDIRQKYGSFLAIILSALIFALIHFNAAQSLSALLMGIVLGYMYVVSKSIWCVVIIHAANNAIALTLANLFPDMDSWSYLIKSEITYNILYLISASLMVIMVTLLVQICRKIDGKLIKNNN